MTSRAQIVAEARSWVGTPFRHQGRVKGEKVDCAGLVSRVGADLGLTRFDTTAYGRQPDPERMGGILEAYLIRITVAELQPGDILWCTHGGTKPRHLAIYTGENIIHAFEGAGECVENRLDTEWRNRIRAAFRFPGVE